jgi:hypothetical protein
VVLERTEGGFILLTLTGVSDQIKLSVFGEHWSNLGGTLTAEEL